MRGNTRHERNIYGSAWGVVHGGYFSDEKAARPLVRELCAAARALRPAVVADLGGGTGFILGLLARRRAFSGARLLDVDCSGKQLKACADSRVCHLNRPIQRVSRREICRSGEGPLLLAMRSVLHYFGGEKSQQALLKRLRTLAKPGEYFVHQTACYAAARDAALMNDIYRLMHTDKRYATTAQVSRMLRLAGWAVEKIVPVDQIKLHSDDLVSRYRLAEKDLRVISAHVARSKAYSAVALNPTAFAGFLEYSVFVCRAV